MVICNSASKLIYETKLNIFIRIVQHCHQCITLELIKKRFEDCSNYLDDLELLFPNHPAIRFDRALLLLNIDNKNGVLGWRQLPVFNVERLENGIDNPYVLFEYSGWLHNV